MARIASESDGLRMKGRRYGSLEPEDFSDDDDLLHEERFHHSNKNDVQASMKHSRRWSVMEKLEKHYGGDTEGGKYRNISSKCVFATLMLTAFIVCGWYFTRTILFNIQLNPELYDFIVVGGGPAGTVVTRRLLDEGAYVLLLEAGDFTQFVVVDNKHGANTAHDFSSSPGASISEYDIPLLWPSVAQAAQSHWGHFNALNVNPFKGLGGSSMEGAMLNVWAVSSDVVSWGVSGWTWGNLLEAYNHLELYNRDSGSSHSTSTGASLNNQDIRGTEGFLPTAETGCLDALGRSFVEAATNMGENDLGGFNSQSPRVGVGCYETAIADGVRVSPPTYLLKSYLQSASKAPRLTLRTKATVRRVILSKEATSTLSIGIISRRTHKKKTTDTHTTTASYRAIGVEYELDGTVHYAYLKNGPSRNTRNNAMAKNFESLRCVVLAAGAVRTPALLLNSGVGPAEALRAVGLEAKVENDRVGWGLRDHVAVGMVFEASESVTSDAGSAYSLPQQWSRYLRAIQKAQDNSAAAVPVTTPTTPSASSGAGATSVPSSNTERGIDYQGRSSSTRATRTHGDAHSTASPGSGSADTAPPRQSSAKDFGILGRNGISAGAFLVSPYALNSSVADIQLTLYPSVTEPHFLALMDKKQKDARATTSGSTSGSNSARSADAIFDGAAGGASFGSDAQGGGGVPAAYRSGRNQILITVALLYPDAEFQVVLNSTFPLLGNPSVIPAKDTSSRLGRSSLGGGNTRIPTRLGASENTENGVLPGNADGRGSLSADNSGDQSDKSAEKVSDNDSAHRVVDNILPRALSDLDVKRLAWAVGRVRALVAAMQTRGEIVWELSPGLKTLSDLPKGNSSSTGTEDASAALSDWVRENAFFQGNWVGSAGMGPTTAVPPIPAPSSSTSGSTGGSGGSKIAEGPAAAGRREETPPIAVNTGRDDDYRDDADDVGTGSVQQETVSSVLDEELRVRGVVALRVVDASAIPAPLSGNIQATVQAVAYRAADFILKNVNSNN